MGIKTRGRSNRKRHNKNGQNSKTTPKRLFNAAMQCFEEAKGFLDKNGPGGIKKCEKKVKTGMILLGNNRNKDCCQKTQALVDSYLIGRLEKEGLKQELSSL